MSRTITADEIRPGHYIIGDRTYRAGTLHLDVQRTERQGNLVTVHALSGPYKTPRMISYGATETVTLGINPAWAYTYNKGATTC